MLTPGQKAEMLSLQERLAYSAARSDIECHCMPVGDTVHDGWHDPTTVLDNDREFIAPSIRYLDLRGLLERHENGTWVRVREEGAPC